MAASNEFPSASETPQEGMSALLAAAESHQSTSSASPAPRNPPPALAGPSSHPTRNSGTSSPALPANGDPSLFIVGMRGSGKTTVGLLASTFLQRPLVDADALFETRVHMSMAAFVGQHGWSAFRERETQLLEYLLKARSTGCVVVLGGGVVEREENRRMLRAHQGPVIHVCREMREQLALLDQQPPNSKPFWVNLHESYRSIYLRRLPLYEDASSLTFANLEGKPNQSGRSSSLVLKHVEQAIRNFVQKIFSHSTLPSWPTLDLSSAEGPRTKMLMLRAHDSQVYSSEKFARLVSQGVDALEYRVDTYAEPGFSSAFLPDSILYEASYRIAFLKRHLHLPVVYGLRTTREGGSFVGTTEEYMTLVAHGFRLLCDVIEISMRELNDDQIRSLMARRQPGTKVLLSAYWPDGHFSWNSEQPQEYLQRAVDLGADLVKLLKPAHSMLDNFEAVQVQEQYAQQHPNLPVIINNWNTIGHLSHCFNVHLTPVTHPSLPSSASPHRERHLLTAVEVERGLVAAGLTQLKQVFHVADPEEAASNKFPLIDASALMQSGFDQLSLPFEMRFITRSDTVRLEELMKRPTFGGALVAHAVHPNDPDATPAARTIGYADVVYGNNPPVRLVPPRARMLLKDNKRVVAIRKCIVRHLSPVNAINSQSAAILEGASGHPGREALFTLLSLGIKTIYMVRCQAEVSQPPLVLPSEARKVAHRLVPLTSLDQLPAHSKGHRPINVVVCMYQPGASCPSALSHSLGGVMVNLSSFPRSWASSSDNWIDVSRTAVAIEQVKEQFLAVTGKSLPSDPCAF